MLFFYCEYTGRKNESTRGQENSAICWIFPYKRRRSSPSVLRQPRGEVGAPRRGGCGGHVRRAERGIPALSCHSPAAFGSNNAPLWPYEPCPSWLIISHLGTGLRRRARLHPGVSQCLASHRDVILPVSCRLLAMLSSLSLSKRQIYLFFFFFPPSLSYLILSFSPFTSV